MTTLVLLAIDLVSWLLWKLGRRRAVALGQRLGSLAFHVVRVRRGVVLGNLAHAFPEKSEAERREVALGCYRQLGRLLVETLVLPRLAPAQLSAMVRFHDTELLDRHIAVGAGAIVCLAHMGNWEMLGYAGGQRGWRFHAITKTLKGSLNRRLHETRRKVFGELPPSGSFDAALALLGRGESLVLIIDQHRAGDRSVAVDFFGRRAATSPSPALFSLRSGRPVLSLWMTLGADGVYDARFRGPFVVPEAPTLAERLQRHSQLLASDLEAVIRERPEEWFWVHRRWKLAEAEARALAVATNGGST